MLHDSIAIALRPASAPSLSAVSDVDVAAVGLFRSCMNDVEISGHALPMALLRANMLEVDYCQVRLLEIRVGRRVWDSKSYGENIPAFYGRVVKPLRRLQRRGVVETLQEITAADDTTPIAVEIIGQVDLTKASKRWGRP